MIDVVDARNMIVANLWMGASPVYTGGAPEFRFIINLYPWEPYPLEDHQVVTSAKLLDGPMVPDEKLLFALADHVNTVRQIGMTLVHCQAGMNRSGLIVALALIRSGMKPGAAVKLIRERRDPDALFNMAFVSWLLSLDQA